MKYVALICLGLSVFLDSPFQYIYPLLMFSCFYFDYSISILFMIICAFSYICVDFISFYLLVLLYIALWTIRQYIILKGKPLYDQLRIVYTILNLILMLIYSDDYTLCLLSSLALYFIFPLLQKNPWILLWAFPCLFNFEYQTLYRLAYVCTMSILLGKKALPLFIFLYGLDINVLYYGLFLLCMIFHLSKFETIGLLCGSLFLFDNQMEAAICVLPSIFCFMVLDFKEPIQNIESNAGISILKLLISFYEEKDSDICAMLKALTSVFQWKSQDCTLKEEDLIQYLKEYGYPIDGVKLSHQGSMIELKTGLMHRSEICGALLTLISNVMKDDYQVSSCIKTEGGYQVSLQVQSRYEYEWDSISFSKQQVCGDAYRIFHCQNDVVALLCDGMGNGRLAQECSSLAIRLFHRLCDDGMPMDEIIHCINALMRSERFTTMDVLRLSKQHNRAQIVKSAACPTLLYRNGEIIEVCSNALPIGIVTSLDVNIHSLTIQNDDVFFLLSDGFSVETMKEWILTKQLATRQGFTKFQALQHQFKDDATMIRIQVRENKPSTCNL